MKKVVFALGGAAVGVAVGFLGARQLLVSKLEEEYQLRLEDEIAKTTAHLNEKFKAERMELVVGELDRRDATVRELNEPGADVDSDVDTETLERVVKGLRYGPDVVVGPATPAGSIPKKRNVFEEPDRRKKYEQRPTPDDGPQVVSKERYLENDGDYTQVTLTYFAGDRILIDDADQPIEEVDRVVGKHNMERFGHKSGDPRVVYVRNDKLQADYEIMLHDGTYAETVAGEVQYTRNRA